MELIRKAKTNEAELITNLALRSKAHWKYTPQQIESWRDDLTVSLAYIEQNEVWVIEEDKKLVGFYAYIFNEDKRINLDSFFVDPDFSGTGKGGNLMRDFLKRVQNSAYEKVFLYSDPQTEGFYKQFGFKVVGQLQSSIPGRFLPIMELVL